MPTWVRVEDTTTGHQFDVSARRAERLVARGTASRVADAEDVTGPGARPRRPKHRTDKAGQPARRRQAPAAQPANTTEETS